MNNRQKAKSLSVTEYPHSALSHKLLLFQHQLINSFTEQLGQWAVKRGWGPWNKKDDVQDLRGYAAVFLKCLMDSYRKHEETSVAMKAIMPSLKQYMSNHNWPDSAADDLCQKVILPFWQEKFEKQDINSLSVIPEEKGKLPCPNYPK